MILRGNVTFSLLLILSDFCFVSCVYSYDNQEIYPFANNPQLSWTEFEQDFRQKHKDIEIPPIIIDNECDFAPMYIHDSSDPDLHEFNKNKLIPYQPPFIIMNTKKVHEVGCSDPNGIAYILLHEAGHHNYDRNQRAKNHADAKKVAMYGKMMSSSLFGLVTVQNLYNLVHNKLSLKRVCFPALAATVWIYRKSIAQSIDKIADDAIGTRSEEYAADKFANQHATKEELQAIQYFYSSDRHVDKFVEFLAQDKDGNIDQKEKQLYGSIIHQTHELSDTWKLKGLSYLLRKIALGERGLTVLNISHPSHQRRYEMVTQALKDRFGIEK